MNCAKHLLRRVFGCLLMIALFLQPGWCTGANELLDSRIVSVDSFKTLLLPEPWEMDAEYRSDWYQQIRSCTGMAMLAGSREAIRAANLAACQHFSEAIEAWTKAIDRYPYDGRMQNFSPLPSEWLLSRASLYLELKQNDKAIADIERALLLPHVYDRQRYKTALLFLQMGKCDRAEAILSTGNSEISTYSPFFHHLLAVSQLKQGKKAEARKSFLEAGSLFAACGATEASQCCVEQISYLDGTTPLPDRGALLSPPSSNHENIEKLLKALASRTDVFDLAVLKMDRENYDLKTHRDVDLLNRDIEVGYPGTEEKITRWLQARPDDARALLLRAEFLFKKRDIGGALSSVNSAIEHSARYLPKDVKTTGNCYLIRKGAYLLEQQQFGEAMHLFNRGFPSVVTDDNLVLRARAENGLGLKSRAVQDLKLAIQQFDEQARIIRRDETRKLLTAIE